MAIKLADTLAPMSEFPAAMAEHIGFSDGATLQEKFDNKELGGGDSSVTLTQEEYEALPEEEKLNGLYYTYDTKRIYKNGVQYGASEPIPLTMEEYKALKAAGAIDEQQEYLVEADVEGIFLGAEDIGYNNAESGIQATTVQGAIDKVNDKVDNLIDDEVSDSTVWSSKKTSDEIAKKVDKSYVDDNFATMDKVALKHEQFDKKVTLTDSNWKYETITFEKNYNNTPSVTVSCGDYLNINFYTYWGCEAYIININNKGCTIRYRSSKASESNPLEVNIIAFVNGI